MIFGGGHTGGMIGTGISFSMHDGFSAVADKIERKFVSLEAVTDRATQRMTKGLNMVRSGFAALAIGGAVLGALSFPISEAIEFEDAFAGVRKTVTATEPEFQKISSNFREISRDAPITTTELSKIGELAGQLGVEGVDNITGFTDTVSKISVTTNLTSEAAATHFARIANIMREPIENVDRMGASVVDLGNNFATTESEITSFANRIAGAGKVAGLTTADIFGISAAFSSVGVQAERGGTAVSKALFKMAESVRTGNGMLEQFATVAGMSASQFATLFEEDAARAFDLFVAGLGTRGVKAVGLLEELELADQRLKQAFVSVAGAGGIMQKAIDRSSEAWSKNMALTEEAEKRYATTRSQLQIMKNRFSDLGNEMGSAFLPVMRGVSAVLGTVADALRLVAGTVVGKVFLGVVAAASSLVAVGGLLLIVLGGLRVASAQAAISFAAMGQAQVAAAFATGGLTAGVSALGVAIWTALAPLLPIIIPILAAIGVVAAGVIFLTKSLDRFNDVLEGNAEPAQGFLGFMQRVGGVLKGVMAVWKSATSEGFSLTERMHDTLQNLGILEIVLQIGTWVVRIKELGRGILDVFSMVSSVVGATIDVVKSSINSMFDVLNALGFNFTKLGGSMDMWRAIGKAVGVIILSFIIPAIATLIPMMISLAASVLAATWPLIAIAAAVAGVIWVFNNWGSIVEWFQGLWATAMDFMAEKISSLWSWVTDIGSRFKQWGANVVESIKTGILEKWQSLKTLFFELLKTLPGGGLIMDFFGEGNEGGTVTTGTPAQAEGGGPIAQQTADNQSAQIQALQPVVLDERQTTEIVKSFRIEMDGREVAHRVDEIGEENEERQ